jgi:hypothetical protein
MRSPCHRENDRDQSFLKKGTHLPKLARPSCYPTNFEHTTTATCVSQLQYTSANNKESGLIISWKMAEPLSSSQDKPQLYKQMRSIGYLSQMLQTQLLIPLYLVYIYRQTDNQITLRQTDSKTNSVACYIILHSS